jgi:hypothetical protein
MASRGTITPCIFFQCFGKVKKEPLMVEVAAIPIKYHPYLNSYLIKIALCQIMVLYIFLVIFVPAMQHLKLEADFRRENAARACGVVQIRQLQSISGKLALRPPKNSRWACNHVFRLFQACLKLI